MLFASECLANGFEELEMIEVKVQAISASRSAGERGADRDDNRFINARTVFTERHRGENLNNNRLSYSAGFTLSGTRLRAQSDKVDHWTRFCASVKSLIRYLSFGIAIVTIARNRILGLNYPTILLEIYLCLFEESKEEKEERTTVRILHVIQNPLLKTRFHTIK